MSGTPSGLAVLTRPELRANARVPAPAPIAARHAVPGGQTRGVVPAGARPILVVESDAATANALVEQLTGDGYHTDLARTAEHARTCAMWRPPRLVVLGGLHRSERFTGTAGRDSPDGSRKTAVGAADAGHCDRGERQ